jgi:Bacterial archaeo-eukaryotic release factor family 3
MNKSLDAVLLTKEELQYLFQKRGRFCVSIFLPTHRVGREIEEDRIQLKNLLRDVEGRLTAAGLRRTEVKELLAPAQQLVRRAQFWRYQSEGLALFLAPGYFRYFRLPRKLQAFVTVGDRFDITPLLPLWTSEGPFHLLALSRNRVRLFGGTRYAIAELDVGGIPRSLHEALEHGVNESQRQQHTERPGLPEDELLYFRQIDKALHDSLKDQRVPLVLAGVEDTLGLYRQVNTYAGLLDEGVAGNPDKLTGDELHAKARKIVQAYYDQARNRAILQYKECADATKTSKELQEILPAAYQGRVYFLFVATQVQKWGNFDPEQSVLCVHESREIGDQDLLNLAVVQTILHGGSVYALDSSDMPDGSSIAALFRYS